MAKDLTEEQIAARLVSEKLATWQAEQEAERRAAEQRTANGTADMVVAIVRIASILNVSYDEAASIYMNVAEAVSRVAVQRKKVN